MNFQTRLAIFCCIVACLLTVSIPLIAEATVGGRLSYLESTENIGAEGEYRPNDTRPPQGSIETTDGPHISGGDASGGIHSSGNTSSNIEHSGTEGNTESSSGNSNNPDNSTGNSDFKSETEGKEETDGEGSAPSDTLGNTQLSAKDIQGLATPESVLVKDHKTGKVSEMSLDDYITSVVAAEMPYTFNVEALKAQAVAARSYCIYKVTNGSSHKDADVCTSSSHCAAFVTKNELTDKYGSLNANKIWKKVGDAVTATSGELVTYKGEVALTLFHARSRDFTENSKNVWGGSYPYLVSVSTPEEDDSTTVSVSLDELLSAFSLDSSVLASTGGSPSLSSTKNSSDRQDTISYLGKTIKAKSLRTRLKLRSTDFSYEKQPDGGYLFTVHGYGHGVGMSQYGANSMANSGSSYIEILTHYYSGTEVAY